MDQQQEVRRFANGSTYWLRKLSRIGEVQWIVTADGVAICSPTTYQAARESFDAVTL
jgi:hypothetical protein